MAYQFTNNEAANAIIKRYGLMSTYKIAGVNGKQTNANNFHTAISGLLNVVGKNLDAEAGMGRTITQEVEEAP